MALTTSNPIRELSIGWNSIENTLTHIYVSVDNDDNDSYSVRFPVIGGSTSEATLETLQEIYASDDGFVDANGDPSEIGLAGVPDGVELEDLESIGIANPLIPGSLAAIEEGRKMRALLNRGTVEREAGVDFWNMKTGAKLQNLKPASAIDINIGDAWRFTQESSSQFVLSLDFTQVDDVSTIEGIANDIRHLALFEWLEDKRVSGTVLNAPESPPILSGLLVFGTRTFSDAHDSVITSFRAHANWIVPDNKPNGDQYYASYNVRFVLTSIDDLDLDNFAALLNARTYNTEPRDSTRVPNILEVSKLLMGESKITTVGNTIGIEVTDNNGRTYIVPLTGRFGVATPWTNNSNTFPVERIVDTVHFHSSSNGIISFVEPSRYVMNNGEYRIFSLHNQGNLGDGYCEVKDIDANTLIYVYPGEEIEFRIGVNHSGVQEVVVVNPPLRNERRDWGFLGTLNNRTYWTNSGDTKIALNQGAVEDLDEDLFEVGIGARTQLLGNVDMADAEEEHVFTQDAVKVKRGGQLTVRESFTLEANGGTPFSWGDGHRLEVWRRRDGSNERVHTDGNHQYFGSTSGTEDYYLNAGLSAKAGDIFWFVISLEGTGSINHGNVQMQSGFRNFVLESARIREEYTP